MICGDLSDLWYSLFRQSLADALQAISFTSERLVLRSGRHH